MKKSYGFHIKRKEKCKLFYRNLLTFIGSFEQLDTCCLSCTSMPVCIIGLQTMKDLAALDGCTMAKETCKSFSLARDFHWFCSFLHPPPPPCLCMQRVPLLYKSLDSKLLAAWLLISSFHYQHIFGRQVQWILFTTFSFYRFMSQC